MKKNIYVCDFKPPLHLTTHSPYLPTRLLVVFPPTITINVKKIWNKERTADKEMGISVLLRLFISSNEVCNTAYGL